jgi:hypothetical protein
LWLPQVAMHLHLLRPHCFPFLAALAIVAALLVVLHVSGRWKALSADTLARYYAAPPRHRPNFSRCWSYCGRAILTLDALPLLFCWFVAVFCHLLSKRGEPQAFQRGIQGLRNRKRGESTIAAWWAVRSSPVAPPLPTVHRTMIIKLTPKRHC